MLNKFFLVILINIQLLINKTFLIYLNIFNFLSPIKVLEKDLIDFKEGISLYRIWNRWAWLETISSYRRSKLGSFWLTINLFVMVFGMGGVFSILWNVPIKEYLPYVAISILLWSIISTMINEGCTIFMSVSGQILNRNNPLSLYVFKFIWKQVINTLHIIIVPFCVFLVFGKSFNGYIFISLFGFFIIYIAGFFAAILLGMFSLRYRDAPMIVANIMQICFFLTPIFWDASQLTGRKTIIADLNIFYHFLEVARAPFFGNPATFTNYAVCFTTIFILFNMTLIVWRLHRNKIPFYI